MRRLLGNPGYRCCDVLRQKGLYIPIQGLHGIHVVAGMGILAWLTWRAVRGDFSSRNFTAVDTGGLYWHIVDVVWIFLFPLLYLV